MTEEEATACEGEDCPEEEMEENATDEIDPVNDTMPGLLLGIQAMVGTAWWLLTMFLYIGTNTSDTLSSVPFIWMFSNLGSTTLGLQALSMLLNFVFYMVVSVVELVAWIVFMTGDGEFAKLWIGVIGYWGSLIAYVIPPVIALLHALLDSGSGGLGGTATSNGFVHDLFLLIGGAVVWIAAGLLHILFVPRFLAHIDAQVCVCSAEMPEEMAEDASDEDKTAHEESMAEYEATCAEECPPEMECELEQEEEESQEDYDARCKEAMDAAAEEGGEEEGGDSSEGGWE
jgi:hypothetical protein